MTIFSTSLLSFGFLFFFVAYKLGKSAVPKKNFLTVVFLLLGTLPISLALLEVLAFNNANFTRVKENLPGAPHIISRYMSQPHFRIKDSILYLASKNQNFRTHQRQSRCMQVTRIWTWKTGKPEYCKKTLENQSMGKQKNYMKIKPETHNASAMQSSSSFKKVPKLSRSCTYSCLLIILAW